MKLRYNSMLSDPIMIAMIVLSNYPMSDQLGIIALINHLVESPI